MYALELVRGLAERGEMGPLAHVPLPASLDELVRARVDRLPAEVRALLETVAATERPTPAFLERAIDDAAALLDVAISAQALVDDDGVLRFTHPLLASAVYARIPPSRRRQLHRRLAALTKDVEERARHLALAAEGPDHEIAAALEEAARHAAARGAPDAAAILVEHARRLTPRGEEVALAERGLAEASYLADIDEHGRARAIVDELLATPLDGPPRARALQLRYVFAPPPNHRDSLALLEQALEHTGQDRHLHVRVLSWLAYALGYVGEYVAAEEPAKEAVEFAIGLGDESLTADAVGILFDLTSVRGVPRPDSFAGLLAVARGGQLAGEPTLPVRLSRERRRAGDLETARTVLEREVAACEERGAEFLRAALLGELADIELRAGNWSLARTYLGEAVGVQIDGADFFGQALTRSAQALLAAYRGDVAEARALAGDAIAAGQEWGWEEFVVRNRWILALVELSLGEPRRAWSHLQGLPDALRRMGIGEPGRIPALPDVVETLTALGCLKDADAVLDELEAQARKLEHRWATPAALRCRALLALARGESESALEFAGRAVAGFEAAGFPFDRGRSLLVAGDALRRLGQRRRAAERLKEASWIFDRLGATQWQARAERELRRAAPRRGNSHDLTAAERRVAELVAAGRTNREVAAELFTTVSTVEAHLTRIFRKLDVRSRTELARRAADNF
jgi:DNA-binding CsgD family transcriptional regulator